MSEIKIDWYCKFKEQEGYITSSIVDVPDMHMSEFMKTKASYLEECIKNHTDIEDCKILSLIQTKDIITRFD